MENQVIQSPVNLTPGALIELKRIMTEQEIPEGHGLRIGVKGGGCAGFSYILGFDKQEESDNTFHIEGLSVIMNPSHGMYLAGMEIDYHEGLDARGFIFNNPNASETCGCGTSFTA